MDLDEKNQVLLGGWYLWVMQVQTKKEKGSSVFKHVLFCIGLGLMCKILV